MSEELPITLEGGGLKIAIAVAKFNELISRKLLEGAKQTLLSLGLSPNDIVVAWAPGSFELPIIAKQFAVSNKFDAVICLGTIIRGETPHFDYVAGGASSGISSVGLETGVPVIFGVLTTDNTDQAMDRAGGRMGHKGSEAATAAVHMANLMRDLKNLG